MHVCDFRLDDKRDEGLFTKSGKFRDGWGESRGCDIARPGCGRAFHTLQSIVRNQERCIKL